MNYIINKFLLVGDKFMPQMHLRQPGFTYSTFGAFAKSKERIQKFKQTGDSRYIYRNELDKACFQHDVAYGDFKDLKRRTTADIVLRDKAFYIAKNPKYDGYQRGLASMVYKFFDKKTKGSGVTLANKSIPQNEQLGEELHKPIIRKFKKSKVYSTFKDNIWAADLADMELISKFNKGFRFLLCVIDIYRKYPWVVPLKDKKGVSIVNAFIMLYNEILDIISSCDNKTSDSCVVYIILFSVFLIISISMAIYVYFFLYLKNRSTNSRHCGCLNINGY